MPPSKSILQHWTDRIRIYGHISKPFHFIKIIVGYFIITLIALSPILISYIGGAIEQIITDKQVNEGNSIFGAIFWLMFYTIPFGIVLFFIWTGIVLKSTINYFKSKTTNL
ncbi:MAG: hypothetical protein RL516_548 [Bacteroidota bacterium]|jgi:hypothetical protein